MDEEVRILCGYDSCSAGPGVASDHNSAAGAGLAHQRGWFDHASVGECHRLAFVNSTPEALGDAELSRELRVESSEAL